MKSIDGVVERRYEISKRTALHAKGNPAVHASRSLDRNLLVALGFIDLVPVTKANAHRSIAWSLPGVLKKSGDLTHP
jgi:hypothetical protein